MNTYKRIGYTLLGIWFIGNFVPFYHDFGWFLGYLVSAFIMTMIIQVKDWERESLKSDKNK